MKITQDFLAISLSKFLNIPLLLLENILIGRILGPSEFGTWSLLLAAATLLNGLFLDWTQSISLRFGCEEWAKQKTLQRTFSTRIPLLLVGMFLILILLYAQPSQWIKKFYSNESNVALLIFFNCLSLWIVSETQSVLQITNHFFHQALANPFISGVAISFLLFIINYFPESNLITIILGLSIVKFILWGCIWLFILREANFKLSFPTFQNIKIIILYGWPIIPSTILGYLSNWGDHILISHYCSAYETGLWAASYQVILGAISINSIFVIILLPWLISRNQIDKDTPKFYLTDIIPSLLSMWLLILIIFITFLPSLFLVFMGKNYLEANKFLPILALCIFTNIFSNLYGILFNLQNRLQKSFLYNIVVACLNLIVSIILIPKIGMLGAAIGTAFSYFVGQFLYVWDQHNYLKIPIKNIAILFFSITAVGFSQILWGTEISNRMTYCSFSLLFFIAIIRKIGSIQTSFIDKFFIGFLTPIGFFIRKILVSSNVYKYF